MTQYIKMTTMNCFFSALPSYFSFNELFDDFEYNQKA